MMDWYDNSLFCDDLPTRPDLNSGIILVTGASGYVGGRLVTELLRSGYLVRIMVRSLSHVIFLTDYLNVKCQPIGIRDVLKYLVEVLETPETKDKSHDIVCSSYEIRKMIPFTPASYREMVHKALAREIEEDLDTRWSDAYPVAHSLEKRLSDLDPPPNYSCSYSILSPKKAESIFFSVLSLRI